MDVLEPFKPFKRFNPYSLMVKGRLMWLDTLNEKHYQALYAIHKEAESVTCASFMEFAEIMRRREGFVVVADSGKLAGMISFSDFIPETDIVIYCFIDPKYRKKWASRTIYKTIFDFPFETLRLPRVTGWTVKSINDDAARFLVALGFRLEGTVRSRIRMPHDGNFYDVDIFGLLKEERRW